MGQWRNPLFSIETRSTVSSTHAIRPPTVGQSSLTWKHRSRSGQGPPQVLFYAGSLVTTTGVATVSFHVDNTIVVRVRTTPVIPFIAIVSN